MLKHDAIADVAVIGLPTGRGDEEVVAVVVLVLEARLEADRLRAWAKRRLATYKVPRRFVEVDGLPRSMLNKVLRGKVRSQLAGRR